ncbi:hypothetical protein YC2023_095912 [Brassica napus]
MTATWTSGYNIKMPVVQSDFQVERSPAEICDTQGSNPWPLHLDASCIGISYFLFTFSHNQERDWPDT